MIRPAFACVLVVSVWPAGAAEPTGTIAGQVAGPGAVLSVNALDRDNDRSYAGTFDPETRRFEITGLPLGRAYDCRIDCAGARLEGVDLTVPRSDYEEEQPLSADDAATIRDQVRRLNQFEDEVEVLALAGNIQHAAVLVTKLRTRPFVYAKPGEVVWRCELWRFEKPEATWVKVQDELFLVLYRERIPDAVYRAKSVTFDPALGGLRVASEHPHVDLKIMQPPDSRPGIRFRRNMRSAQETRP